MTTDRCPRRPAPRALIATLTLSLGLAVSLTLVAAGADATRPFPELITLPADFGSEGIAVGRGSSFYVGSFTPSRLGQILVGNLRTGGYVELVPPSGRMAVGMKVDPRTNYLFVAAGTSGGGAIYDAGSGAEIGFYPFLPPSPATIVNDVTVTHDAAYFTVSTGPFLGRVALDPNGQPAAADTIPLPPNFGAQGGCTVGPPVRSNGIAATPNGKHLILAHMSEGNIYLLDTDTLVPVPIDITGGDLAGGQALCAADGVLLDGKTLYVAQFGPLHRVAVVELSPDYLSGVITRYITEPFASNPAIRLPTTLAEFGSSLYAVTYGGAPPSPDVVVRLLK